jgi:CheY-like chemotaxis protein
LANEERSDSLAAQIGSMVHDLRNVFSAIRGFATVIAQDLRPGDPAREDVEQILKAVDHGSDVTQRLAAIGSPAGPEAAGAAVSLEGEQDRSGSWKLQQPRRSATVLVVEDDDLVRTMTIRVLRRNGYATLEASTAEDAERQAQEHPDGVDLLLADVGLPRSGGPALAGRLRQRWPSLKVLFMSGLGMEAVLEQGIPPGTALLEKPFAPRTLLDRVDDLLAPGSS